MSERGEVFTYTGFDLSPEGVLTCRYALDGEEFVERIDAGVSGGDFSGDAAHAAARIVWLLAGVSYYKTAAPHRIEVTGGLSAREREFLATYYRQGLAEFSYRTGVEIGDLVVSGQPRESVTAKADADPARPLIPFGGGIDSIVVVDQTVAALPPEGDAALFVVNTSDVPFEPIEATAGITGLPVVRARRHLDPKVLESKQRGYLNGHVPVTGVISAIAVLVAIAQGRGRVVMSNEHSASEPTTLVANGVPVNHQWSKSYEFEALFRELVAEAVTGVEYYSALRPYSELWVARRFAELREYHLAFRSCNRAFHVDPGQRLPRWCGECDKCCFIDLILAPYLSRAELEQIFGGHEPLANSALLPQFYSLVGEPGRPKPLECVGDEGECRRAVELALARDDRADSFVLSALASYLDESGMDAPGEDELLTMQGEHFLSVLS